MFSRLDPLFKTTLRQTEATDARLAVRRDEEKEERRHRPSKEADKSEALRDDQTEVSVAGLIAVLESLVYAPAASSSGNDRADSGDTGIEREQAAPGTAARAAGAYQETAQRTAGAVPPAAPEPASSDIRLTAGEIQAIIRLLDDLRQLEKSGINLLRIPQGDSFLHSLQKAIRQARI